MSQETSAMIFIQNKYTRIYYSIISNAQTRSLNKNIYTEKHHIIPKSLGGNDSKENLVILTAREHFICHWLLIKMTTGTAHGSMVHALFMMKRGHNKQFRYKSKISSRVYSKLKEERSALVSQQLTGRPVSIETRIKLSASQKGIPREKHTEDTKAKMRESHKNRKPDSIETRKKKSEAQKGKTSPLRGIPLSEEHKAKLRNPKPARTEEHKRKLREAVKKAAELRRLHH